ncbi:MAG: SCP2 sterol-binding domain-containing protein [Lachnospiraceae bacterium]|jgi:multimeric flavodoxin WrbA/putative sterol carrier protein|nr:SCP2 sterol-binding domain-containing protein [Lachnospiraceae bacterium]
MKINIYYGGRGFMDDPTLYVINKMQAVLEELHVSVERFNLYELKNSITTLPQTLKTADGVILATTVEWYGIGGFMQQFLDACWLYGDKEKIAKIYMCPIVMSTTYGEREGKLNLSVAWEILGGLPCSGICGYITDGTMLENNEEYMRIIEKKTENMYRSINQKVPCLPTSNQAVKQMVSITKNIDLTPQESEQLSQYVSDDVYVQRQKEDIQELTSLFRDMMSNNEPEDGVEFIADFKNNFHPKAGFKAIYKINIDNRKKPLYIEVNNGECNCHYGENGVNGTVTSPDVEMQISYEKLTEIVSARMTFQRAFMSGDMKSKGNFMTLRTLDQLFEFGNGII